jgi:hypothetical protein
MKTRINFVRQSGLKVVLQRLLLLVEKRMTGCNQDFPMFEGTTGCQPNGSLLNYRPLFTQFRRFPMSLLGLTNV